MFTLDITKDHCPMTFVKVKLMLAKLKKGDVLDVRLSRGEPLENVPKSAAEEGIGYWKFGTRPMIVM